MKKLSILSLVLTSLLIMPIYANGKTEVSQKPTIAVTIIPEETFVRKIAEDKVNIITIIPKGSSPENYEPTPKQRIEFENADIYFPIGVQSEINSIIDIVNTDKTKIVHLADEISTTYPPIFIGETRDPHVWLSPKRVLLMIDIIERELSLLDNKNASFYKENALNYKNEIKDAVIKVEEALKASKNKSFLVYHPAFNYFGDDFNLNMLALEKNGKDLSPKSMMEVINQAKKDGISNIFYQAEIAKDKSISISEELGGKAILLEPLSPNYVENLITMANTFKENF